MALTDEARETVALKEVMIAGQDGKVYFYNLQDGTATRDAIDLGVPSAGGLSLATNGTPLGVGQSHSGGQLRQEERIPFAEPADQ